jgi:transposase
MESSHLVSAAFPALRTVLFNRKRAASTLIAAQDGDRPPLSPVVHLFTDHARAVVEPPSQVRLLCRVRRWSFSPYLYRARNLIERFFNSIKHCRRAATRYDKSAANDLAFVQLASTHLWLRGLATSRRKIDVCGVVLDRA